MGEPLDVLRAAFSRYERALTSGDRSQLVGARAALCAALVATGWSPPAEVADQMARDGRTLRSLRQAARGDTFVRSPSHRPPESVRRFSSTLR